MRNIRFTTLGSRVSKPVDVVMELTPAGSDLVVEGKFKPADIASIRVGQPAAVKLDAYDYAIYGVLSGTVKYINADALTEDNKGNEQPYYRVQIKTSGRKLMGKNRRADPDPAGHDGYRGNQYGTQNCLALSDETDHQDVFGIDGGAVM